MNASHGLTASPTVRPPLKWAGGKRWQLRHLAPLWASHRHRRLVEPFCGGLSVALGLHPSHAVLNDLNPHVINFYRWVQRGLTVSVPLDNSRRRYYALRKRFNTLLDSGQSDSEEAACLFYYLNRTGYNGLCRFNRSGRFNVPFGRYARIAYRENFGDYVEPFAAFEFSNLDFEAMAVSDDDFIYADPPYDVEFRQYGPHGFSWDEQVRTAEWLARHKGPVVLSNAATERIEQLYRQLGFTLVPTVGPRLISCTGDRSGAREVMALRNMN